VGENGSQGWRNFAPESDDADISETQIDATEDILDNSDLFKTWAAAERSRTRSSRIPAKTSKPSTKYAFNLKLERIILTLKSL
jgi:hypothetical protein